MWWEHVAKAEEIEPLTPYDLAEIFDSPCHCGLTVEAQFAVIKRATERIRARAFASFVPRKKVLEATGTGG